MSKCLYPYCSNPKKDESYFRAPSDSETRRKWMSVIPQVLGLTKDSFTRPELVFLCSNHFEKSCFLYDIDGKICGMKSDAVPSIFYIPSNTGNGEDVSEDVTHINVPPPPEIHPSVSSEYLKRKVRNEVLKLLIVKEKLQEEEGQFVKSQELLEKIENGDNKEGLEEVYSGIIKKLKTVPKKNVRKKPKNLEEVLLFMRKEKILSEEAVVVLLNLYADIPYEDATNPSATAKEGLKSFAQYLAFYSTEVYENIGSHFDFILPPIKSVREVFNPTAGEPGWSQKAFDCLKQKAKDCEDGKKLLCSLLVGTLSLRRKEEWDGKKMRGYVDCGPSSVDIGFNLDSDGLPTARSVLVFLAVPLDPQQLWRVPVAYFYVNMITSKEKANLIRECILRLHNVGSIVLSVTCNVFSSDKIFLNSLGLSCDLLPQISPYFVNPADPLLRVHFVYDSCSLLTTVQNMWASSQGFLDAKVRSVNWQFVSELIKLQEAQAGAFSQTFEVPHWSWDSGHIRTRLLAQLFTESTADAMEFCCNVLKLDQFNGCEGTVNFIRVMSKVKKLLESRRYMNRASDKQHETSIKSEYFQALDYLRNLRDIHNELLYVSKCGSIRLLYQTLLSCQELMRQVPSFSPHCVSLNELEVLFYIIRIYCGWTTPPTARQFTAALTKHVETCGYNFSSPIQTNDNWWIDSVDISMARREGCIVPKPEFQSPNIPSSCGSHMSLEYTTVDSKSFSGCNFIAVSIVKTLASILYCEACLEALQEPPSSDNPLLRLLRKTCGAILCPSQDVLRICVSSEQHLQVALKTAMFKEKASIFEWKNEKFANSIGIIVVRDLQEKRLNLFPSLKQHFLESPPDASHLYRLVRGISCCYVQARLRSIKSWCPV